MMYTMPKNLLSICVNFTLATQQILFGTLNRCLKTAYLEYHRPPVLSITIFHFSAFYANP